MHYEALIRHIGLHPPRHKPNSVARAPQTRERCYNADMARLNQRLGLTRYEADEHYKKALEEYGKRHLDAAILEMDEALRLLPTSSEYYAARGFFFLEDGVNTRAAEDFDRALKIYRFETLALYGRGVIAYREKDWERALAHFTEAYRSRPKRPETLYYLALAQHRAGLNPQAIATMQQAAAIFEQAGDKKRSGDAAKWIRAIERVAAQEAPKLPALPGQSMPGRPALPANAPQPAPPPPGLPKPKP
jgi:tetratricopeptide (TPR) repeat protein